MKPSAPEHKIIFFSLIFGMVIFLILGGIVFSELLKKEHTVTIQNELAAETAPLVEIAAPPVTTEDKEPVENSPASTAENEPLPEPSSPDKPPAPSPTAASFPAAVHQLVSWGFTSIASRQIDTVIIHSSYNALGGNVYDLEKLLLEYKQYAVAPHYLIDREGAVFVLVPENKVAFHAGAGETPDGRKNINNFSIGIELMNTEKDSSTEKQYTALNKLLAYLKNKYTLKYILGHNQTAPGRKTDPWNLDWKKVDK